MKLSAIIPALVLSGCAIFQPAPYIWFDSGRPKLDNVRWEQHHYTHIQHACGFAETLSDRDLAAGCVVRLNNSGNPYCLVLSTLSEDQAKKQYDAFGVSHYEHEADMHCRQALNHVRKV